MRLRFSKLGKLRWTSHRDVARMWERAFRRVGLSLAYTQGFSPRPRVSFGLALPTGAESDAEYLDVELAEEPTVDRRELVGRLSAALPVGLDVLAAAAVDDRSDSLQHLVTSCSWRVDVVGVGGDHLQDLVRGALAAPSLVIPRQRKGQTSHDDVRPGILSCRATATVIECELAAQPRTLRPSELLVAMGLEADEARVRRTHQWIERDGARWEPLPLDATTAPHVRARAS